MEGGAKARGDVPAGHPHERQRHGTEYHPGGDLHDQHGSGEDNDQAGAPLPGFDLILSEAVFVGPCGEGNCVHSSSNYFTGCTRYEEG